MTGFITFKHVKTTMYLPISPQWNGLMPPVVQLYTRAVLGLQGVVEEGHSDVGKNKLVYIF